MRMMQNGGKAVLVALALAGCVPAGSGCTTYSLQRADMPPLPETDLGAWVAVTDTAMTRACR